MYKRIISVFLALLMLLSLCACRRKNPAVISDSFVETPVTTEEPQATPSPTPDNGTPTHLPTLNWVESEDGQSMTAIVPTEDGQSIEVSLGITDNDNPFDDNTSYTDTNSTIPPLIERPTERPTPTTAPTEAPVPTNIPSQPQAPTTNWTGPATDTTLAEYEAMSGEAQMLFYYSFANADDFNAWYNAAKEAHDAAQDYIEIGGNGVVNAGG